jgi:hypothetical protein
MTGAEIVALFQKERDAAANKLIETAKADHKEKPEIRVPKIGQIKFRLGKKKPRRPTPSRVYEAQQKLLEAMVAFPDLEPDLIVRAVSRHLLLEPIVIARLWSHVRQRYEHKRVNEAVR